MPQQNYISPTQVSDMFGIPKATLANWRSQGKGFPFSKVGKHIYYSLELINEHLERCTVTSTGEVA